MATISIPQSKIFQEIASGKTNPTNSQTKGLFAKETNANDPYLLYRN